MTNWRLTARIMPGFITRSAINFKRSTGRGEMNPGIIRAVLQFVDNNFLKLHPNLWMWVPRVERTLRIPPSMMLQSWMGSDFTNDDLTRDSSEIDDYDHELLGIDPGSPATRPIT